VLPVLPCTDTVKQLDSEGVVVGMPDRSLLRVTQTPRGFSVAALRARPQEELLAQARMVAGDPQARRLSSGFDLTVAQAQFTAPV
jgi:2-C-methyl-D-erythritol 4-phosphate cytidylyltransferase